MNISLAAEELFSIGSIGITNAVFTSFLVFIIIVLIIGIFRSKLSYANPGNFQLLIEFVFESLYTLVKGVMDLKYAKMVMSFATTIFLLVLFSNWFGLLPIVPSISVEKHAEESNTITASSEVIVSEEKHEKLTIFQCLTNKHCYVGTFGIKEFDEVVHVFRAPSSDLSFAITLALVSVITTNLLGFFFAGKNYLKKYVNFKGPIEAFVGLLEIISEFGKLISFSFRLFGNIFAGEILLVVITSISFGLATLPFLLLEIFVGAIQAFVFFMLTSVFIGLAVSHQEH